MKRVRKAKPFKGTSPKVHQIGTERESTQTENTSRIVQSDKCTHLERKKVVALNNSDARHAYTQYAYRVEKV